VIRLTFDVRLVQGGFTLEVADDADVEVLGLYGPSGSGKTTLLEVIAGLRMLSHGMVSVGDGVLVDTGSGRHLAPHRRHVGYVPQDGALFPHLDVRGNVTYGIWQPRAGSRQASPDSRRPTGDSHRDHIYATLDIAHLLNRQVRDLSGGERQRVAIARALVSAPRILLLDEPLTGIDPGRKDRILPYLLRIRRELHVPMVYVTHEARELVDIADRVLRLEDGRLVDAGRPVDVLSQAARDRTS
jgi:molybdate transport system ATP-binding protein